MESSTHDVVFIMHSCVRAVTFRRIKMIHSRSRHCRRHDTDAFSVWVSKPNRRGGLEKSSLG